MKLIQMLAALSPAMEICTEHGVIRLMPRHGWQARDPELPLDPLPTPVPFVIISVSQETCRTTEEFCAAVLDLQSYNINVKSTFLEILNKYSFDSARRLPMLSKVANNESNNNKPSNFRSESNQIRIKLGYCIIHM